ncbi:MAG: tetratricopeptide repeat protein, partial [Pseudomonadota bacterium]
NSVQAALTLAGLQLRTAGPEVAIDTLEKTRAKHPDDRNILILLNNVYAQSGNTDAANDILAELVRVDPDNVQFRTRFAASLLDRDDPAAADAVILEGVQRSSDSVGKIRTLIGVLLQRDRVDAAKGMLEALAADPEKLRYALVLGDLNVQLGEQDEARKIYARLGESIADSVDPHPVAILAEIQASKLMIASNERDEAKQTLDQVLTVSPTNTDALRLRATLALADSRPIDAIADLRAALRSIPDAPGLYLLLAQAHASNDEPALSEDAYRRAIGLRPDVATSYLQFARYLVKNKRTDEALKLLDEASADNASNRVLWRANAQLSLASDTLEQAERAAAALEKINANDSDVHHIRGAVARRRGDHLNAALAYERALESNPNDEIALLEMVRSLNEANRTESAIAKINEALKDKPDNARMIRALARLHRLNGDELKARAILLDALEKNPKSSHTYVELAGTYLNTGEEDEAINVLERGSEAVEDNFAIVSAHAVVQERIGAPEKAIALYEAFLSENPKSFAAANNLSMLLVTHRQDQPSLDRALALATPLRESGIPNYLDTLGWVHFVRGESNAAIETLQRAVELSPGQPTFLFHLGEAHRGAGQLETAEELLTEALTTTQPFPEREQAEAALQALRRDSRSPS